MKSGKKEPDHYLRPNDEKVLEDVLKVISREKPHRVIVTFDPDEKRYCYYSYSRSNGEELIGKEEPQPRLMDYDFDKVRFRRDKLAEGLGKHNLCDFMILNRQITRCADIVIQAK
ncbi:MAG: hypothetical protein ABIJ20_03210 [Nanoarchaeota archaeon]|nr:hypothetical protein [Nanoarchaeota archaeon]MBU1444695.1 hypothetical protein [Nanoarchaeota archaeon]MBU2420547.1 hypothetical protein [Nanoarchaeota archaeon]MBU2475770.1 hypothetical protein [Nanoarchaeota archaeon]